MQTPIPRLVSYSILLTSYFLILLGILGDMAKTQKIVVANWKMNPQTFGEAKDIFAPLKKAYDKYSSVTLVVCPPFLFINNLRRMDLAGRIELGGQDIFYEEYGAYTGEISAEMLKSAGARYVIVGHSERRSLGETDAIVAKKVNAAVKAGLTAVVCIGEAERDLSGSYFEKIEEQLKQSLQGVQKRFAPNLVVAYEPIWAIGKSAKDAMSPSDIRETVIFIRKVLSKLYDADSAFSVPILYGGSVAPQNIEGIIKQGEVAGVLVGRDSLVPPHFIDILKVINNV